MKTTINKAKSWYFGKGNKIDRPLVKLFKKKREKVLIKILRLKEGHTTDIRRDFKENKGIPRTIMSIYLRT